MFRNARARRRFLTWLAMTFVGTVIGYFYVEVVYRPGETQLGEAWQGARAGFLIAGATAAFEIYVIEGRLGARLRRLPFLQLLTLREIAHATLIVGMLLLNIWIGRIRDEGWTANALQPRSLAQDIVFSFIMMAACLFVFQMRNLIGGRTLRNFVIGRYYRPVEETRVFLIVDLVGSSPIAQQLGNQRFHAFLSDFFFHIDGPVVDQCGEVYTYVGDAMIASWPKGDADNRARALAATAAIYDVLRARSPEFARRYGCTPSARAALHVGEVVAGECGDSRRQITYLGDTLNAVSRLEALAKRLRRPVLASKAVVEGIAIPDRLALEDLGRHDLAGFAEPLAIVALAPAGTMALPMPGETSEPTPLSSRSERTAARH